ncbi:MAG: prepilin peptidase [Calditrichaeota bacterium]|nr:MAG: prepilin peptidase [Calditrichota bacterium]
MEELTVILIGLAIGSFLNVVIYRLPRGMSLWYPGSSCPSCGKKVAFYDNIPVLSYLILKGKCRRCHAPIGIQYPLVEMATALIFGLVYHYSAHDAPVVLYLLFAAFMVAISIIDWHTRLIYNKMLIALLLTGVLYNLYQPFIPWSKALIGFLAGGGVMWFIGWLGEAVFKKESLGMGDVKFAAVAGFYLGALPVLAAAYIGFVSAFLVIIVMKSLTRHVPEHIPLGPFLAAGFFMFLVWGNQLTQFYLNWMR